MKPDPSQPEQGFTAIELLVTIAIAAILAALAAPSFNQMIERYRAMQTSGEWENALYFARSEGIKRGGGVVLRKETSGDGCSASTAEEWSCGWFIFHTTSNSNTYKAATDTILQRYPQAAKGMFVMVKPGNEAFRIDRWGKINGISAIRLKVTPDSGSLSNTYIVCSSIAGRILKLKGEEECPAS